MRVAHINAFAEGSTGNIMLQIAKFAREKGFEVKTYSPYPFSKKYKPLPNSIENHEFFGSWFERRIHNLIGRIIGWDGYFSRNGTRKLIRKLEQDNVELIHLHNLHGYFINIPMLFKYIKRKKIKVIWTLHDCWTFTGHCAHYEVVKCDKWKTECKNCPQLREYPQCILDNSKHQYKFKKKHFLKIEDMTLVTPSQWLADQVKLSFLGNYNTQVIYNGIDLSVFKPTSGNFREKNNCMNKTILLGVAFDWSARKGLDVFEKLAKRLDNTFQIVLVGVSDKIKTKLPENIISIERINSKLELAQLYSEADIFINPTREEVLGMVNIESLACGTPVITFKSGGSPECIDETCGVIIEKDNIESMIQSIIKISREKSYSENMCVKKVQFFNKEDKFKEYIELYEKSRNNNSLL